MEGENLVDMIKENLIAERIAIETYREMVRYFGDKDSTTRVLPERILAHEATAYFWSIGRPSWMTSRSIAAARIGRRRTGELSPTWCPPWFASADEMSH